MCAALEEAQIRLIRPRRGASRAESAACAHRADCR